MATANFEKDGKCIDYTNSTGAIIPFGTVIKIGDRVGVALADIGIAEVGALGIVGVYEFPAATSLTIAQGDNVYYHTTTSTINKTALNGVYAGFATTDKASDGTVVGVKIN